MKQQSDDETAIVVFDLDGTITRYDTYVRFLLYVIRQKPLKLVRLPLLSIDVLRHKLGSQSNTWLKKRFLRALLAGHDQETINAWAMSFSQQVVESGLYEDAIACVEQHQSSGVELVLLSASLDIYVQTMGEMLGFNHVICTRTTWNGNVLGNELDGGNCYGNIKLERINQWLESRTNKTILAAYGDHESDFPMLKIAQQGIVVNPDEKLRLKAINNQLAHVNWK